MQRAPTIVPVRMARHEIVSTCHTSRHAGSLVALMLLCCSSPATCETYPLWAGAAVTEWEDVAHATVLTDMSRSEPAASLSKRTEKGRWKVIPYEMKDGGLRGNMVWTAPHAEAPELSLALPTKGWFAMFVGLFSATEVPTTARLALDSDPAPVARSNSRADHVANSVETFFKVAQLNGNNRLLISQPRHGFASACGVTHIRLIPLTTKEIERVEADRRDVSHRTMAATIDGFSFIYRDSPRTPRDWLSEVEIYRNTDFGTLLLQSPGADKVIYSSSAGHLKGSGYDAFPRQGDYQFTESIREMARQKVNPLKVMMDGAHGMGMKVHAGIRPAGWSFLEPYSDYWESPFYQKNPRWRCEDRDGTPVARMSWAIPEVRRHMIDILLEQAAFSADGVHLVFNRGYPVVLYEPAARKLFEAEHHVDPRTVPESDPRIIAWWSGIVNTFFQELRMALDEQRQRRGTEGRIELSVMVLGNEQDNLKYGVDLRRLVEEKMVDAIYMYLWDFGAAQRNKYDLPFFQELCTPHHIPFKPASASFWDQGPYYTLDLIRSFYDGGASGVTIWDAGGGDIFQWSVITRMGHVEETRWRLDRLAKARPPDQLFRFHKLGAQILDGRFPPYWGG